MTHTSLKPKIKKKKTYYLGEKATFHLPMSPFQVVVKSDKVSCAVLWQKAPEMSLGVLWWLSVFKLG